MAKFRLVHTSFWDDPTVVEEMTAEDKYFFLYLLTNERTTQIGIYQTTKKQIAFDIGHSIESAGALLQRFTDHHKIIKYNPDTREIAIKNWGKYNLVRGGKPILDCVKSELKQVKDISLIKYVGENVPNSSIRNVYESYYVTCNDTSDDTRNGRDKKSGESSNTNGSHVTYHDTSTTSGQEQQQEKEEEQEKEEKKEKQQQEKKVSRSSLSSQIFELIESNNFAALNSYTSQEVEYMINDTSEELTLEAFKIAIDENKRKLSYVKGIIRNWKNAKLRTLADLEIYESNKRGEQNGQNNRGSHGSSQSENNRPTIFGDYCSD